MDQPEQTGRQSRLCLRAIQHGNHVPARIWRGTQPGHGKGMAAESGGPGPCSGTGGIEKTSGSSGRRTIINLTLSQQTHPEKPAATSLTAYAVAPAIPYENHGTGREAGYPLPCQSPEWEIAARDGVFHHPALSRSSAAACRTACQVPAPRPVCPSSAGEPS